MIREIMTMIYILTMHANYIKQWHRYDSDIGMTILNEMMKYGNLEQTKNPLCPYKCIYGKTSQTNWKNTVEEKTYFLYNRLVFSLLHGEKRYIGNFIHNI
jgi:hypothetical protein